MQGIRFQLSLLVFSLGGAASVAAQVTGDTIKPINLAPLTVTGERTHDAPPPVATIDVPAAVLHRTPSTSPYDLIRRTTGIEVHEQGQGPGFAPNAVIRGFTSDHSSDMLFVLDGIPINLPIHGHVEGYADWSIMLPMALSSVRVIHGPASPLYGDFAFGGVVEAFTSPDARGTIGSLTTSSFGDVEAALRTGAHGERAGVLLAGSGQRDEGWRRHSNYWLGTAIARGWHQVGMGRLEAGLSLYGSTFNSPGFVTVAAFNAGDLEPATDTADGGSAQRAIAHLRYSTSLGVATQFETSVWGQLVSSTVFLNIPEEGVVAQTDEEDFRSAAGAQAQMSWKPGTSEFTVGVSGRADDTEYDLYDSQDRVRGSHTTGLDGRYYSGGAYARWRMLVGSRVALDLGGRLDRVTYRSLDRLIPSSAWQSGSSTQLSPKIGARYLMGNGTTLLASLSRGFRGAPGLIRDPGQSPMVAWAKEVGARYDNEDVTLQLAVFRLDVANERIQDPVTREITGSGSSRRQGVNAEVDWRISPALQLSFEGTLNDAKITGTHSAPSGLVAATDIAPSLSLQLMHDEPLTPGATVPGVARYHGRIGVDGRLSSRLDHHVEVRFSGPFTPIGEPTIRSQPYAVLDLGVGIRLPTLNGTLDVTVQNAVNTKYAEVRASGFINPGTPRVLRMSFRFGES